MRLEGLGISKKKSDYLTWNRTLDINRLKSLKLVNIRNKISELINYKKEAIFNELLRK
jgi:hypothetical protein